MRSTEIRDPGDPTLNVRELQEASTKRQDDLRAMEAEHVRHIIRVRAEFAEQFREAESRRIDAVLLAQETAAKATAEAMATNVKGVADSTNARIAALEKSQYESKGSGVGMRELWGWAIAGLMAAVTIYNMLHKQ